MGSDYYCNQGFIYWGGGGGGRRYVSSYRVCTVHRTSPKNDTLATLPAVSFSVWYVMAALQWYPCRGIPQRACKPRFCPCMYSFLYCYNCAIFFMLVAMTCVTVIAPNMCSGHNTAISPYSINGRRGGGGGGDNRQKRWWCRMWWRS